MATIYVYTKSSLELLEFTTIVNDSYDADNVSVNHKRIWNQVKIDSLRKMNMGSDRIYMREPYETRPHWHNSDSEQRLIYKGSGSFYIPQGDKLLVIECGTGDLVWIKRQTTHWFRSLHEFGAFRYFSDASEWKEIPDESTEIIELYNDSMAKIR